MQITQRKTDGKWVLLGDAKEVVKEFDSRDEAVEYFKNLSSKPVEKSCKHGNKGPKEAIIEYNPKYSEGHWKAGEGVKDKSDRVISETIRWSEPYILHARVGQICLDCGEAV